MNKAAATKKSMKVDVPLTRDDGTIYMYEMRTMEDQEIGSREMLRRSAFKAGFRSGAEVARLHKEGEVGAAVSLEQFRPSYYAPFETAYYEEGLALGMECGANHSAVKTTPWGDLESNGGTPRLPLLSDRMDLLCPGEAHL